MFHLDLAVLDLLNDRGDPIPECVLSVRIMYPCFSINTIEYIYRSQLIQVLMYEIFFDQDRFQ